MKPEQIGDRIVQVGETMIPAVNIQVDGFPQYVENPGQETAWYPLYFEIMFEDGWLWVVDQEDVDGEIQVEIFTFSPENRWRVCDYDTTFSSWEEFLDAYNVKRKQTAA